MFMQAMAPMAGQTMAHFGKPMLEDAAELRTDPVVRASFTNGMLGGSAIILGTLLGFVFDQRISNYIVGASVTGKNKGVGSSHADTAGYGPLLGAALGAAAHSWMSGKTHGRRVAVGMTAGTLVPAIPIVAAIGMRKNLKGPWPMLIGGLSAAILVMHWQKRQSAQLQATTMATLEALDPDAPPHEAQAVPPGTQPPPASMSGGY
jgi:hypothetical protein